MNWQHIGYIVVLSIATGLAILVALLAWTRRRTPGSIYFALLMVAVAVWAFTGAVEFSLVAVPAKILWGKLSYLGIVNVSPLWLLFALRYNQQPRQLSRIQTLLLWIVPVAILTLAATNERHHLVWSHITPVSDAPGALLIYEHGVVVWFNAAYSYLLLLIGTIVLVRVVLRSAQLYRRQVGALLLGAALPWIGNVIYVFGLSPWPGYDITPVAFALTGLTLAYGLFRFRMFDLVPVARDALIENMADGVLVLDARDRLVDVNPAACRLIGCDATQIVGQPAQVVLAEWFDPAQYDRDVPSVQAEIVLNGTRWLDLRVSSLYDRRRQSTGWLIVLHDITDLKQSEMILQQYTQELEARNTELDAFAHTVAHDLKSPVSAAVGYGALLETRYSSLSDDKRLEMLRIINRNGYRMSSIIDELLLLARVRHLGDIESGSLDMHEIVAEAQDRLAMLIEEYQAEISVPEVWPVALGYAAWVQEVWVNYLSNAIKYGGSPAAGVSPCVQLGWDEVVGESAEPSGDGRYIRFWVRDNGPGLKPEEQARLFTPFTRLDQVRVKGHGLGLSIVRRIVDKFGGQVGVESELGCGSTFWFTLRAAPAGES
ncbi:MAG: PAS domain S-box protein [Anaerolineae bacterium]|nr:PAS domain S-box protein [Anaerolineae bacterium]